MFRQLSPSNGFTDSIPRIKSRFIDLSFTALAVTLSGCAVHYYDAKTGAEHIYGFGHLVMKASSPQDGHQALIRGSDILGFQAGKTDEGYTFGLGWNRHRRVDVLSPDTAFFLEWPSSDFLDLRIGTNPMGLLPTSPSKTISNQENNNESYPSPSCPR